ncbi:MAG: hypothetical protein [Microvirus sp.]|nr:MAG: hypothetical protein [Microvirus sp.]
MSKTKRVDLNTDTGEISLVQPRFKTQFNKAVSHPRFEKKSLLPSETLPDQAMSIREILTRHKLGLPMEGGRVMDYDDPTGEDTTLSFDDYKPDLASMDIVDRKEYLEWARLQLDKLKTELNAIAKARNDAAVKRKADVDKALAYLEEQEKQRNKGIMTPAPSAGGDFK